MNTPADSTCLRSYAWLFWGIALLGFSVDQWSKYEMFAHLSNSGEESSIEIEIIPGVFRYTADYEKPKVKETGEGVLARLRTVSGEYMPRVNTGALFGMGRNGNTLFAIVSVIAALAILFWGTRPFTNHDRFLTLSLGLILAGTLGNLYDRLVFNGVRDFLHWYYFVDWPVFNIADCCLVCGAGILLLHAFFTEPATEPVSDRQGAVKEEAPQETAVQTEIVEVK
jgi:signal peptidase II